MKILKLTILIFLWLVAGQAGAFCQNKFKEVHIGEKVPDIVLSGFKDDTARKVRLSSMYSHKLLLLDFWGTWCASCISKFPRMDSLKKEFGDQIEVVAVGYEPYKTIQNFFSRYAQYDPRYFSVLTHDKVLSYDLFPHRSIPHVVWIDSVGKVIAITEGENLTSDNIKKYLAHDKLLLSRKIDRMNFDARKPFHLRDSSFTGRTIFTNHTDGIESGIYVTYGSGNPHLIDRIFAYNVSIRQLYWIAGFYNKATMSNFGRMVLEIKDSLKYMQPSKIAIETYKKSKYYLDPDKGDWDRDNLYCYELQLPKPCRDTIAFRDMMNDLNRNLNIDGRFEKRPMKCFILKYNPAEEKHLIESNGKPSLEYDNYGIEKTLHAQTIGYLTQVLNHVTANSQIVDETGISKTKLFDFAFGGLKLGMSADQINHLLETYGLFLTEGEREVPSLVITEH